MAYEGLSAYVVSVCVDCVSYLAYGEGHENVPTGHGDLVWAQWGSAPMELGCPVACCGDEPESWFSWGQCQGCESRLGGDREHATVWLLREVTQHGQ